jgi:hypothetical protein
LTQLKNQVDEMSGSMLKLVDLSRSQESPKREIEYEMKNKMDENRKEMEKKMNENSAHMENKIGETRYQKEKR